MSKRCSEWKHITIFDKPYSLEKQAEGMAVHQAVATGACNQCGCLKQCSTDEFFKPSIFAWCQKRKHEILTEMKSVGRGGSPS